MKKTATPFLTLVSFLAAAGAAVSWSAEAPKRPRAKAAPPVKLTAVEVKTFDRVYKETPEGALKLFLYQPAEGTKTDKRPAILFFFGGGWKQGTATQFQPQAEYFAARGMVCACAEYRIRSVHGTTPDRCVEDAKSALRWLRGHAGELGVDPDRIVAAGGSAGGHLAAATALVPGFEAQGEEARISCKPNALVLFNPALHIPEMEVRNGRGEVVPGFWPTPFLSKDTPPAILLFGSADRLLAQGRDYAARAKVLGVRAELFTGEGQPHGFFNRSPWTQVTARQVDLFLASLGYVQGEPALQLPAGAPALRREE